MQRRYRVVVARSMLAKPGLDEHDRGAKALALGLRDAGFEVIYTGLLQSPEQIVETVVQEDADALGLSVTDAARAALVPAVAQRLRTRDRDDVVVFDTVEHPDPQLVTAWLERTLDAREARLP